MRTRSAQHIPRLVAGLVVFSPYAWSLCGVPGPRLLCAEYATSQAVVIAKLVGVQEVASDSFDAVHIYKLEISTRLRGRIDSTFQVREENNSGRADFDWIKGAKYLLFAYQSQRDGTWFIHGCGNSGPLNKASAVLKAIKSLRTSSKFGAVEGMTSTDSWSTPVPDVAIRAIGNGTVFTAKTDLDGHFRIRLPIGSYRLEASRNGWFFETAFLSYENAAKFDLSGGGCAQIQLEGKQSK